MAFDLIVNGTRHTVDADPQTPLLWVIRDHVGLTGTKFSCGIGQCGACTLHVDGRAVRSCSVPAATAIGKPILTIEGLSPDGSHPIQLAWKELDAPQCGYCQSGMIMSTLALLQRHAESDRRRHRRRDDQRLPLQHLPPHPPGDSPGRRADEGAGMTSDVNRREFLATVAAAQGAFVLGFWLPSRANAQTTARPAPLWYEDAATPEINAWIVIAPDDTVTIRIAQTELGQGVWTSNAMMVCEELQCDWSKVRPQYASANRDAREKAPAWTLKVPGQRRHRSQGRRRADVRQSRPHRRLRHSRQPLSTHADERGLVREGRPLLSAAGRSRSA